MDKDTFRKESVSDYIKENYYAVKLDAESDEKISFDGKHQLTYQEVSGQVFKVTGYPAIVLLTPRKEFAVAPGYRDEKGFLELLKEFKSQLDK